LRRAEATLFVPDTHVPFHDEGALSALLDVSKAIRPRWIVVLGDFLDCYRVSRWSKDPAREIGLQDEIEQGRDVLDRIMRSAPGAKLVFIEGNHEDRLRRFLWDNPGLAGLKCLEIPDLLRLDQHDLVASYKYGQRHRHFGMLVEHGKAVRKGAGQTARAMLDSRLMSGVSGHTHRLGQVYRSSEAGTIGWIEAGCICHLDPEYIDGAPDWQHGCAIGWQIGDTFHARSVRIHDGTPIL
jgi:predicted phosphodiesterase